MTGPDLTIGNWLLASAPVGLLVLTILLLNWSAPRAGAAAWALALALGLLAFGAARDHVAIASAKGLSLALFVLTIVWASVYMFNLVDRLRGIDAIGRAMARLADDRLTQALLIGWGFSSFIQGITGFGVPIAVAAPLLIMLGFSPARAAGMALVGHGWAVTFGSMGSSYYTIQLVTGIEGDVIAPHMALLFAPIIVVSGSLVAHIHGGLDAVRRSLPVVIVAGAVMAAGMYVLASVGAPQIASSVPAVLGMVAIALVSRTPLFRGEPDRAAAPSDPDGNEGGSMPFWLAFMPYLLLITLSVISQIGPIKEAVSGLRWALDYPGFVTGEGFAVPSVDDYAPIRLLNHPAPLIAFSVLISAGLYVVAGRWRRGVEWEALKLTYSQCLGTTIGVATMVMMAVVMADSGMTVLLAPRRGGRLGARLPPRLAVHRPARLVHEREQHELQRHVRAAPAGDRARARHRHGDDLEHPVDRRLGGQSDGAGQGARRRRRRGPRRQGARDLPDRDPLHPSARAPRGHRGDHHHRAAARTVEVAVLSDANKQKLRHAVLLGTIVSFPLLYLGPVTLESAAVTVAGLVVAGVTAVLAWLAF